MRLRFFVSSFGLLSYLALVSVEGLGGQMTVALGGADGPIGLEVQTLFSVGTVAGPEWETFSSLSGVAFDGAGNLYVLDPGNCRVVKIAPDGTLLAEIGRRGGGPGEFSLPVTFAVSREGQVHVYDVGMQSFSTFDSNGSFLTTAPLAKGGMYTPNKGLIPLPDGRLITGGRGGVDLANSPLPSDPSSRRIDVLTLGPEATRATLYEGWHLATIGSSEGSSVGQAHAIVTPLKAFFPALEAGVLPDGGVAVIDSTSYRVKIIGLGQEVLREIVRPFTPIRVSRRMEENERERRLKLVAEGNLEDAGLSSASWLGLSPSGGGHGSPPSGETANRLRERILNMEFGNEIPVITGLTTDWAGRIWVQRSGERVDGRGPVDILSGDGRYLGTLPPGEIELPDAFGPLGLAAWIERGEFDVPVVVVKRLVLR